MRLTFHPCRRSWRLVLENKLIARIDRPNTDAHPFFQMSTDPQQPKAHEDFDWNTEEKQAIDAATEEAKRLGLDSFEELLDTRTQSAEAVLKLLQRVEDAEIEDITPAVIGVISERTGHKWLFFKPADHIYEGADAIGIGLQKPELGDTDPDNLCLDHDVWCIIQQQPLLLRSMYGAIFGFKNSPDGVDCVPIYEGDDGWT